MPGSRLATAGQLIAGVPASCSDGGPLTGPACLLIRTTGQKYDDWSRLRQVVPDWVRLWSEESALIDTLPTKSCTCWAPFLMPGCATGLSGLSLRFPLVPQSTWKTPRDPPGVTCGVTTLGRTSLIGTKELCGAASAKARLSLLLETIPAATDAIATAPTK